MGDGVEGQVKGAHEERMMGGINGKGVKVE